LTIKFDIKKKEKKKEDEESRRVKFPFKDMNNVKLFSISITIFRPLESKAIQVHKKGLFMRNKLHGPFL
jgi:hypothetical protein